MKRQRRTGGWLGLAAVVATAATPLPATAQTDTTFIQTQRRIEQRVREQHDQLVPPAQRVALDAGGWYSVYLFLYDDGIESSRTLRRHDLYLWGSASADQGVHEGYARMRMSYLDFNTGDAADGNDDDLEGPNLDRGWYQFDLAKALEVYGNQDPAWGLQTRIGRDFVEMGTGYALSLPLDAVQITADYANVELYGLIARTIPSYPNLDRTRPRSGSSDNCLFGIQLTYKGLDKHEPFAYVLWNEDHFGERPEDWFQNYDYDSFYLGVGSTGEVWLTDQLRVENLRYSTEWVYQTGESWGDRRFLHHDDICAWGFDVLLEYLPTTRCKPRFLVEYMFASGDPDRRFSPTDARGGNRKGHKDQSFVAFGYRDTGLSFAPRNSNIHIWRAGASFDPFPDIEALRNLRVGTDWFLYQKARRTGAVSDPTADKTSGYLGWEMDYFADWRVTSDLSATVRYGVFFPGSAFSDQTTRTFLFTGLTWSF